MMFFVCRIIYAVKRSKTNVSSCESKLQQININVPEDVKSNQSSNNKTKKSKKKTKSKKSPEEDIQDEMLKNFHDGLKRVNDILRNKLTGSSKEFLDVKETLACTNVIDS